MIFDIIISGGGMVGAALAVALKDSPYKIALIDAMPFTTKEDTRLIALNYASVENFKNLNVWPALASFAEAIQVVHVSHQGRFGTTRISAEEFSLPYLGQVVPACHINTALYAALETQNNLTLFRPAVLEHFTQNNDSVSAVIKKEHKEITLEAKLLVGADGSHSLVRDILNSKTKEVDYHQSALVTTTTLQRSHHHIAYERFLDEGAIAMLPLKEHRAATIITLPTEKITALMQLSDTDFLAYLQKNFGYRLGRLQSTGHRSTYPLRFIQTEKQIEGRVVLIGNAAHTLHPVAAQGLNIALSETAMLSEYLLQRQSEIHSLEELVQCQQKIRLQLSHRLAQIFSVDFFMINVARQVGMVSLDFFPQLKKRLLKSVTGF